MKKVMSFSLAALLAASAVPAAFAQAKALDVKTGGTVQAEATVDTTLDTTNTTDSAKTTTKETATKVETSRKDAVQKAVQLKQDLIKLRQELKAATEVNAELKAKYESLVTELEKQAALKQALEVQLELLNRFYKPGDQKTFAKLGELYEKTGDTSVKAFVNGKQPVFDVPPFIEKGRTLVPVRAISAALKADVQYDAATRSATITRGDMTITLYLDKAVALVNGTTIKLDTKPVIKKGRLFLPLRFVSEQLKAQVKWQAKGKIVIIEDPTLIQPTEDTEVSGETNTDASAQTGTQATTNTETGATTQTGTNTQSGTGVQADTSVQTETSTSVQTGGSN